LKKKRYIISYDIASAGSSQSLLASRLMVGRQTQDTLAMLSVPSWRGCGKWVSKLVTIETELP